MLQHRIPPLVSPAAGSALLFLWFHLTFLFHVIFLLQQVSLDYVFLCFVSEKSTVRISVGVIPPELIDIL